MALSASASASILPSQAEWRHLFRALIRECSYLPDPIASSYMHQYVVSSYRHYTPKYPTKKIEITPARQIRLRRRARKTLSILGRANQGYSKPLERVLLLSYGRIGARRRQLLQPLTVQPTSSGDSATESLTTKFSVEWKPSPTLMALLKDQIRQQNVSQSKVRPHLKTLEPKIPKENIWGRPTPRKRQKNIRHSWYAKALDAVYPPLPYQEWQLLQGLVNGTVPWNPPKRRKTLERSDFLAEKPQNLNPEFLVTGPKKGFTFASWTRGRPHKITLRFMQRTWARISVLCPIMTWDISKRNWNIQWGSSQSRAPHILEQSKSSFLFGGVNTQGKAV